MVEIVKDEKVKVVHLQYGSSSAGNYTIRQHEAFLDAGIDSKVLSLYSSIQKDPKIKSLGKGAILRSRINQRVQEFLTRHRNRQYGAFSYSFIGTDVSQHTFVKEADFIYVHYVLGGFLSLKNIEQLAMLGKPVFIVMHDMWAITGGCSYSFECDKFLSSCHNCPILSGEKENDLSAKQFSDKKKFYDKYDNLYFISPSTWLYNLAMKANLTKGKPVFRIPNPISDQLFKPFDKRIAKEILNISKENYVISFGANKITSPYKGWKYLQASLQKLKAQDPMRKISILIFGSGPDEELKQTIPFDTKFMGYVSDDYTTNLIYNASDVFVAPSLADNLPTTIIESLRCGTPVVGFNIGGIPDMIVHEKNGYLANYKDSDDLAKGIDFCLTNKLTGNLSQEFDIDKIIKSHFDLFSFTTKKQKS